MLLRVSVVARKVSAIAEATNAVPARSAARYYRAFRGGGPITM